MNQLAQKKCIPCSGEVPPLPTEELDSYLAQLDSAWHLIESRTRLRREIRFSDYKTPWQIVDEISQIAEEEWHHPEISFGWGHLEIEIWTHKINALVESDFIFAAKVDEVIKKYES